MSFNPALNPDQTVTGNLPDSKLSPDAHRDLSWALALFAAKRPAYQQAHAYYNGDHPLTHATDQFQESFKDLLQGLVANVCPLVVQAITDRLKVTGFESHDSDASDPEEQAESPAVAASEATQADIAWGIWQDARLDRHANQLHVEAVKAGDAFLLVWPDPDDDHLPRFYPQYAYDVVVRYDAERRDRIIMGAKLWAEYAGPLLTAQPQTTYLRCNLYYADRVEKYRTQTAVAVLPQAAQAGIFAPYLVDGEAWPLRNPYGVVPLFHFAYSGGIGQYGRSELADVVPLQNQLNKQIGDTVIASEFAAFRQRVVMGAVPQQETNSDGSPKYDATGNPVYKAVGGGVDRLMLFPEADTKIGEWSAADMRQYVQVKESLFGDVARITGIPLHHLLNQGRYPSGQALRVAESRLVAKVEHTQIDFGDVWEDALTFALMIAGVGGEIGISAKWMRPDSRDELEHATAVQVMAAVAISAQEALRLFGYTEAEIALIMAERQAEQAFAAALVPPGGGATTGAASGGTQRAGDAQGGGQTDGAAGVAA